MKTLFWLPLLIVSSAWAAPVALVYKGPGACIEGCAEALAVQAQKLGYLVKYVGPTETDPSIFVGAKLWIQPGGTSRDVAKVMVAGLRENIRSFVASGGGYAGFCAGGFFATQKISDSGLDGLGLIPGTSALYLNIPSGHNPDHGLQMPILWNGEKRDIYWEGGPFFTFTAAEMNAVDPTAYYSNGTVASVRAIYGGGRVYITGLHPEAPVAWKNFYHLVDTDGQDDALVHEMLKWASGTRGD